MTDTDYRQTPSDLSFEPWHTGPWASAGLPPTHPPAPPADPPAVSPPSGPTPPSAGGDDGDHSRAGAIWVTATGAFLLLAAAAVFVAVQWDSLSNEIKLGILAALTGACLLAGRGLHRVLPATSGVLTHLGAFLIPVNVAAYGMHAGWDWPMFALVEGVIASVTWFAIERTQPSVVLRSACVVSVAVAAAGLGALVGVPTALVLVAAALVAERLRLHRAAITWALVAGLAPILDGLEHITPLGTNIVRDLGIGAGHSQLAVITCGVMSAFVLGKNAHRRGDLTLVSAAALCLVVSVGSGWSNSGLRPMQSLVAAATLFLLVELVAHAVRGDAFWGRPARILAIVTEVLAGSAVPCLMAWGALELVWRSSEFDGTTFVWNPFIATVVAGAAWFIADLRRRHEDGSGLAIGLLVGGGYWPTTLFLPVTILSGVAVASGSGVTVAIVAMAFAAVLIVSGRPAGHAVAASFAMGAVVLCADQPDMAIALGASGALCLAVIAVMRARMSDHVNNAPYAWLAAMASLMPVGVAIAIAFGTYDHLVLLIGGALAAWAVAAILDRGAVSPETRWLGYVGRVGVVFVLFFSPLLPAHQVGILAGVVALLCVIDGVRLNSPVALYGLPIAVPVAVAGFAFGANLTAGETGLALCVVGAVAAGVQILLPREWSWPVAGVVGITTFVGFGISSPADGTMATAFIIIGGIGLIYAAVTRISWWLVGGWTSITIGIWMHLTHARVQALDAYVAPVALALVVAGVALWRRADHPSSWFLFAPPIVLLGGAALSERFSGGHGVHALVAGGVGLLAVAIGGAKRLIGPMLLGTALLVAITVHESLGVTRQIPTWAWLTLGGAILLAVGITMERRDTGPLDAGRRIVDVVHEQFG